MSQVEQNFTRFTLSLVAAIASAADGTPSLLEPFQPSTRDGEHADHAPHSAPDSSLPNVPESEFSTSPLIPHSHSQSVVPAAQPPPLPSHSDSFTMPIPKCLWCGTQRQADSDCCEWSILKGSSNQQKISPEWIPRLAWDDSKEGGGGGSANLPKKASTLSMANFGGMKFGLKKNGPMAALQWILSGKF